MINGETTSVLELAIDSRRSLSPQVAREFLEWQLSDTDNRRLDELTAKSKQLGLSEPEADELSELCETVDLLSLLHLRARSALGTLQKPGA